MTALIGFAIGFPCGLVVMLLAVILIQSREAKSRNAGRIAE